jgi:hypothetical protein
VAEIKMSVTTKGYESHVTLNNETMSVEDMGIRVTEWLEFQLRYLAAMAPGESVTVTRLDEDFRI